VLRLEYGNYMTAMFEFNPEIMGVDVQIVRARGDEWPYNGIHFSFVLCACARGSKGRSEREGFIKRSERYVLLDCRRIMRRPSDLESGGHEAYYT